MFIMTQNEKHFINADKIAQIDIKNDCGVSVLNAVVIGLFSCYDGDVSNDIVEIGRFFYLEDAWSELEQIATCDEPFYTVSKNKFYHPDLEKTYAELFDDYIAGKNGYDLSSINGATIIQILKMPLEKTREAIGDSNTEKLIKNLASRGWHIGSLVNTNKED